MGTDGQSSSKLELKLSLGKTAKKESKRGGQLIIGTADKRNSW